MWRLIVDHFTTCSSAKISTPPVPNVNMLRVFFGHCQSVSATSLGGLAEEGG